MMDLLFEIFGDRDDEASRLADVAAQLPVHTRQRARQVTARWSAQFSEDVRHIPRGASEYSALWNPSTLAADALTAGDTWASREAVQREHLAFFTDHPRSTASSASFFDWSFVRAGPVREGFERAIGQSYASAMRGEGTDRLDSVDSKLREDLASIAFDSDGNPYGRFTGMPDTGDGVDAALRDRIGDIIAFFKGIALNRVYDNYLLDRLMKKWEEPPNRDLLHTRFRNAPLRGASGGYHEWIPTNMTKAVVDRASLAEGSAASGTRHTVQWINAHHYLRSETSRVYAHLIQPTRIDPGPPRIINPDADVLEAAGISTHVGAAATDAAGRRGAGLVGQDTFHEALRSEFSAEPRGEPAAFIDSLHTRVKALLWTPDLSKTGVPAGQWNLPIGVYFRIARGAPLDQSMTWERLRDRQVENISQIDRDFDDARNNLDAP